MKLFLMVMNIVVMILKGKKKLLNATIPA